MKQIREQLKKYFKKGAYPTEGQFADLIDSFVHKNDTDIAINQVFGLADALNSKCDSASITDMLAQLSCKFKTGQDVKNVNILEDVSEDTTVTENDVVNAILVQRMYNNIQELLKFCFPYNIKTYGAATFNVATATLQLDTQTVSALVSRVVNTITEYPTTSYKVMRSYKSYTAAETTAVETSSVMNSDTHKCEVPDSNLQFGRTSYTFLESVNNLSAKVDIYVLHPFTYALNISNKLGAEVADGRPLTYFNSVAGFKKTFNDNSEDSSFCNYLYICVPVGWTVTNIIASSTVTTTPRTTTATKVASNTLFDIFCSDEALYSTVNGITITLEGIGSLI